MTRLLHLVPPILTKPLVPFQRLLRLGMILFEPTDVFLRYPRQSLVIHQRRQCPCDQYLAWRTRWTTDKRAEQRYHIVQTQASRQDTGRRGIASVGGNAPATSILPGGLRLNDVVSLFRSFIRCPTGPLTISRSSQAVYPLIALSTKRSGPRAGPRSRRPRTSRWMRSPMRSTRMSSLLRPRPRFAGRL
jgi:hypothetical protein